MNSLKKTTLSDINVLKIKPMFKLFDNTKENVNLKCSVTSKAIVYFFKISEHCPKFPKNRNTKAFINKMNSMIYSSYLFTPAFLSFFFFKRQKNALYQAISVLRTSNSGN